MNERLKKQMDFILEIDKIKTIFRQTRLINNSRFENDAEHAWHISMMALVLAEYSNEKINILKVLKMLLIHDIVEIDAGDVFLYDAKGAEQKKEKETRAAERIFGLLPEDTAREYKSLWQEFEDRQSPEAKFAAAMDRMEPVLQNYHTGGYAWKKHGIKVEQVKDKNKHIGEGAADLWSYIESLIDQAKEKKYLK